MTYSIVARDPETGDMGVAVQSHYFSVGSVCQWGEAGVGTVATQSLVDPSYGPLGLELMGTGKTSVDTLRALLAGDTNPDVRQVAMIDAKGNVATHTGAKCIAEAGHVNGDNFSVQANMMLRDTVWEAMADAYQSATGGLAYRMLTALDAAEAEGGDIRGRQSAVLMVVAGTSTGRSWVDKTIDIRVDDHPEPLVELRRLLNIHQAYRHVNEAERKIGADETRPQGLEDFAAALAGAPDNVELRFWHAITLASIGNIEEALPVLKDIYSTDPNWRELLRRLPASGLMSDDPELIARLTEI